MNPQGALAGRARCAFLLASVALILAVTLVPTGGSRELQLVPFLDLKDAVTPSINGVLLLGVLGNILLFMPLGAALGLRGSPRRRTVLIGFLLSSAVEIVQLFIPGRTTSTDDLVLNTAGALVGWAFISLGGNGGSSTGAPKGRRRR